MRKADVSNARSQDILQDTALISDTMNVMNLDTLLLNTLTKYHIQEHQHITKRHTGINTTDQALGSTTKTKEKEKDPDHSLDTASSIALAAVICTEATQGHNNGIGTATIEAAQGNLIQHTEDTPTGPAMTHHTGHTADHLHTTAHQATTLKNAVDHIHDLPTNF